jgi:hypothetical protein
VEEALVKLTSPDPKIGKLAVEEIRKAFVCEILVSEAQDNPLSIDAARCGWRGHKHRTWSGDPRTLHVMDVEYLVIAHLKHTMRHAFPLRFLIRDGKRSGGSCHFIRPWHREEIAKWKEFYEWLDKIQEEMERLNQGAVEAK